MDLDEIAGVVSQLFGGLNLESGDVIVIFAGAGIAIAVEVFGLFVIRAKFVENVVDCWEEETLERIGQKEMGEKIDKYHKGTSLFASMSGKPLV
jgi:hypothetical protein